MALCICRNCNQPGTVKINLDRRGGRNAYMCNFHAYSAEAYSFRNNYRFGKPKANKFSWGIENETSYSDEKARAELQAQGFIPTSDCTVNCEYKSGILRGLNGIAKFVNQWDRLIEAGHLEIGDGCGTHTHVGHADYINAETNGYMRRFYHSLFIPLCDEMKANPDATIRLFGRDFTGYAWTINEHTHPGDHSNFINLQHSNTIEYRLCKYRNAAQYMNLVHCLKDFTTAIINNFIKHFNDTDIDGTRYHNMTEYRKHKAQVTAKKLVKIYRKYSGLDNNGGDGESCPADTQTEHPAHINVFVALENPDTGEIVEYNITDVDPEQVTQNMLETAARNRLSLSLEADYVPSDWRLRRMTNEDTNTEVRFNIFNGHIILD